MACFSLKPPVTDSLLLRGSNEENMLTALFKSTWRLKLGLQGELLSRKTCRVSVHFSDKPLSTLSHHPVALTPNLWQLATPERCENYGS